MALHFFNDVFLLHLPLETPEGVLEGFSLLQPDFSQRNCTSKLVPIGTG